ncbi:transporter [Pseudonocardia sp. Ae168_Ps1]|nr:transporter [Pseudonocardia sp. Ae168_Ps1]
MTDSQIAARSADGVPGGDPSSQPNRRMRNRVLLSSFVGSVIEWYDFYLFGIASAAVFGQLYFPEFSSTAGTLAAFATLAAGFIARPLGGIVWGHFGDRVGRKGMLVLSIVLMGVATTVVGLLPTYATIGIWAPLILVLMRLVQGVSAGGEWGGAVLMSMEHAPKRRGLSSSVAQMGLYGGILLANGVFAAAAALTGDAFLEWGWRIPFLLSAVLVLIGLWIKLGVEESPVFTQAREQADLATAEKPQVPLVEVLRHPKNLLLSVALVLGAFAASALYGTWIVSYGITEGFPRADILNAVLVAAAIGLVFQPVFAYLSDLWGRRVVVGVGAVLQALSIPVMFALMDGGGTGAMYLGISLAAFAHAIVYSPLGAWLGELFPTTAVHRGLTRLPDRGHHRRRLHPADLCLAARRLGRRHHRHLPVHRRDLPADGDRRVLRRRDQPQHAPVTAPTRPSGRRARRGEARHHRHRLPPDAAADRPTGRRAPAAALARLHRPLRHGQFRRWGVPLAARVHPPPRRGGRARAGRRRSAPGRGAGRRPVRHVRRRADLPADLHHHPRRGEHAPRVRRRDLSRLQRRAGPHLGRRR